MIVIDQEKNEFTTNALITQKEDEDHDRVQL